jgi:methionine biosynthesis protein MetW
MPRLVEEFYEEFHRKIDKNYHADKFLLDRDLVALNMIRGSRRVFELGCGTGRLLELIQAERRCGIDISTGAVEAARSRGIDARRVDIDSEDLPFPDRDFDAALVIETLEHLFDPIHALAELNRVLEPGGRIAVACPNIGYWISRIALMRGRFTDFTGSSSLVPEHIRFYTINSLRHILRCTGFRVLEVHGCAKLRVRQKGGEEKPVVLWPTWRTLFSRKTTFAHRLKVLIHLIDKHLSPTFPGLARGLCLLAQKEGPPEYRRNFAIDCFTTPLGYMTHYRRG